MPPRPSPANPATLDQTAAELRPTPDGLKAGHPESGPNPRASPPCADRGRRGDSSPPSSTSPPSAPAADSRALHPSASDLRELVAVLAAGLPPIDLSTDTLLTPAEVIALLPARRRGRKAHKSTVFRWYTSGCRGLRLPFLQVGNQRCTSLRALQAFLDALTAVARFEHGETAPSCPDGAGVRGTREPDGRTDSSASRTS